MQLTVFGASPTASLYGSAHSTGWSREGPAPAGFLPERHLKQPGTCPRPKSAALPMQGGGRPAGEAQLPRGLSQADERAERIDGAGADPDFEVEMRASRVAGRADDADHGAGGDPLADVDADPVQVGVHRGDAPRVGDHDETAPAARAHPGPRDTRSEERRV